MDTNALMTILLVIVGLGIIASEIFIPSAGLLSLIATGCFCGSAFCAWKAWYEPGHLAIFWTYAVLMILGIPAFIGTGVYLLPKTALGNKLLQAPQELSTLTPFQEEEQRLSALINEQGKALTLFSPGGMVQIGNEKFHAESEGVMVEAQTDVVVIAVKGNRLVVRPLSLHQTIAGVLPETPSTETPSPEINSTEETAAIDEGPPEKVTSTPDAPPAETVAGEPSGESDSQPDSDNAAIDFDIPETA
ncbi:MAG: hypothetical protein H8E37_05510 [Planctomycetes bacterium]|nr:hypothetical protein [Planctomycetota bacterium]